MHAVTSTNATLMSSFPSPTTCWWCIKCISAICYTLMSLAYTQTLDQKLLPCKRKQCCSPPPLSAKNIAKMHFGGKKTTTFLMLFLNPVKAATSLFHWTTRGRWPCSHSCVFVLLISCTMKTFLRIKAYDVMSIRSIELRQAFWAFRPNLSRSTCFHL